MSDYSDDLNYLPTIIRYPEADSTSKRTGLVLIQHGPLDIYCKIFYISINNKELKKEPFMQ